MNRLKQFWQWLGKHHILKYWDPVYLYAIAILLLSSMPNPPSPEVIIGLNISNTMKHVILYFGFGFLLGMAFRHSKYAIFRDNHYLWAIVFGILFAVFDEFYQGFIPGRVTDGMDMIADSIGVVLGQTVRWVVKLERKVLHKIF